jgi:signal peptidase I
MKDDQSMGDPAAGLHSPGGSAADGPPGASSGSAREAVAGESWASVRAESAAAAGGAPEPDGDAAGADPAGSGPDDGDEQPGTSPPGRRRRSGWRELPVLIVVALVIALLIKTFLVQAFFIPSSSMENTLLIGDKVLVNKIVYHLRPIRAGDVVVFDGAGSWDPVVPKSRSDSDPIVRAYRATLLPLFRSIGGLFGTTPGQTDYIKRVIGVPGDHVVCCTARGQMTVNGVALHERSYLFPGEQPSQLRFNITVPPGRLWVMGDHRLVSDDSRLHTGDPGHGTIPENEVIGRAFMIVWPPSRWRILPIPATFDQHGILSAAAGAIRLTAGPNAPYFPLAGGLALALPITWLQRRARQRGVRLRWRVPRRR